MHSTQYTRLSGAERGFSLVELMVATTVLLAALGTTGAFFVAGRRAIQDQIITTETIQGLRAAEESIARDVRLSGACLPPSGDFVALDAVNSATDQILLRTGLVQANGRCVTTVLTADILANDSELPVQATDGWASGMRAYIRHSNGATGESFEVTGVSSSDLKLRKTTALSCPGVPGGCPSAAYPVGSGVFAVDERQYGVDVSNPSLPTLTVAVDGAAPSPLAAGITNLQIQYVLAQNCDTHGANCTVVDIPANDQQFALVNQVYLTLTAKSLTPLSTGQYFTITRKISAKPRNLLPNG